jgi:hypothetical protein
MLVRLLYASRAVGPVTPRSSTRSCKVVQPEPALGITGVLCHGSDVYMQALEGGREAVNALYMKIARDTHHRDVMLLHYAEVPERHFAGWTMGHVNLGKLNPSLLLKYSDKPVLDPFAVSGRASMALLEELIANAQITCRAGG